MEAPRYTVTVGGVELERIETLSLRFSMTELADSFTATLADTTASVVGGMSCSVAIEGRIVLVGELMTVREVEAPGTHDVTIVGYSSAQRLVKSSLLLQSRTITNRSLRQIVEQVVEPFGLVVDVSESGLEIADEPIERVRARPAQTAFAFLQEVAKRQGCILVSGAASVGELRQAKASVRITRVAVRRAPVVLVFPSPRCQSFELEHDVRSVHSQYLVNRRGRGRLDDDGTLEGRDGVAYDERVRYSPLILQAEKGGTDQASLDRQAEFELRKRAAEGQRVLLNYHGWSPRPSPTPPSPLWWPNTLFRVVNTRTGFDELMLLGSVELGESTNDGALARLEFMPPDAFSILKSKTIKAGRRGYGVNQEWVDQHAELVGQIASATDNVNFDEPTRNLYWDPEDDDE